MAKQNRGIGRKIAQTTVNPGKTQYEFSKEFTGDGATGANTAYGNASGTTGAVLTDKTGPDGR